MSKGAIALLAVLIGIIIGVGAVLYISNASNTGDQSSAQDMEYVVIETDPGVIHEYTITFEAKEDGKLCIRGMTGDILKPYWYDTENVDTYYYYKAGHNEVKCLTKITWDKVIFTT